MLRRFCNITGKEIQLEQMPQQDLAPEILHLLSPLSTNLHPIMVGITNNHEYDVRYIGFGNCDSHIRLEIELRCDYYKSFDTVEELQGVIGTMAKGLNVYAVDSAVGLAQIHIPFTLKSA